MLVKLLIFLLITVSTFSWSQTPSRPSRTQPPRPPIRRKILPKPLVKPVPPKAVVAPQPAPVAEPPRPYVRYFQIGYFSEFLGPALQDGDGFVPDVDKNGNPIRGTESYNLWNQFSFRWRLRADSFFDYFINPRFTLWFGPKDRLPKQDNDALRVEDFLVGGQATAYRSGRFSWYIRPGYRLPTSVESRESNFAGQAEFFHTLDWTEHDWSAGLWNTWRFYVTTYETTTERWKLYLAPYFTYYLDDTKRFEVYVENEWEHNAITGKRSYNHLVHSMDGAYVGVSFQINPSLSLYPFLRTYTLRKFDTETIGLGLWTTAMLY